MLSKGDNVKVYANPVLRMGVPLDATIVSVEAQYGIKDERNVPIVWALVRYAGRWEDTLQLVAEDGA